MCPKATYIPEPIDTSDTPLPSEFDDILEIIAKSVHDAWALQRMKEGWSWGPCKNDQKKTTPLLVPYEDLPEEEQEYDRITARQTILQLLSNGYRIVRK